MITCPLLDLFCLLSIFDRMIVGNVLYVGEGSARKSFMATTEKNDDKDVKLRMRINANINQKTTVRRCDIVGPKSPS